ncbi:hypothetical protein CAEBREN_18935 [Caenorhabditis brenneri]|uniref:DUF7809 domain-containing protein n=1 Tax=Caenorhabditis brenneri TaxID=135651 RepID=G0NHV1_CAEBE|nr:hypothetical protein CAEBREN_18935 [Caenorhabditis brenneri]
MLPFSYIHVLNKYTSAEVLETLEDTEEDYEKSRIISIGTCKEDVMKELDKFRNFPGCLQKFGPKVRSYQLPPIIFKCPVGGKKMRKFIYKQDAFNCLMQQLPLDGPNKRISEIVGSICEAYLKLKEAKLFNGQCELVEYNINDFKHLNYEFKLALEKTKDMVIHERFVQDYNFNDRILQKLESAIGEVGPGQSVDSILDNRKIAELDDSEKKVVIRQLETLIDGMEMFIKGHTNYFSPDEGIKSIICISPIRIWRENTGEAFCFAEEIHRNLSKLYQEDMDDEIEEMCGSMPIADINFERLTPYFKEHVEEYWDSPLYDTDAWLKHRVLFLDNMKQFIEEHPRYFTQLKNPRALQVRMFMDDHQEPFCLSREVFRALLQLNCNDKLFLDKLEDHGLQDQLFTVNYEDFKELIPVGLKDFLNEKLPVLLIKTPIMRTKNRAIFIPSYDGQYCILVADAFLEILRWLISDKNFFEETKYQSDSWEKLNKALYLKLKAVDQKFVTNKTAPSFVDVTKLERAKEMLRDVLRDEFEIKNPKVVMIENTVEEEALNKQEEIEEILNDSIDRNNNEGMLDVPMNNEEASNDGVVSNDEETVNNEESSNTEVESNVDNASDDRKTPVKSTSELKTIIMQGLNEWLPNLEAHLERELDIDNKPRIDEMTFGEKYEGLEYCLLLAVLENLPQFSSWLKEEKARARKPVFLESSS